MLGISYFKGQPSDYIIKYSGSRQTRAGQGLSFFYLRFNTQIVAVPTQSIDCPLPKPAAIIKSSVSKAN